MLSIVRTYIRKFFARAFNNSEAVDATMLASLDAQIADLVTQGNQNRARLEAISTSAGSLRYSLTQRSRQVATASQTAFTVSAYDNTNDIVDAWTNSASGALLTRIDPSSVTKTSSTVVTIPAQTVGAIVVIDIRSVGNGTSQLASTSTGQGAGLVGYANTTGLGSSPNAEGSLDELYTDINSATFLAGVLTLSNYIKKDGTVAFTADQSMGTKKLTNLGAGSASSNDAARMADITPAALQTALGTYLNATYVPLAGGVTITGDVAFSGGATLTGLPQATASGEPLTFDQLPTVGSFKNAITNGAALFANSDDYVASVSGTYGYGKSELCKGALTGSTVAGTLTRNTSSNLGHTGNSFYWSSVTTTGSGVAIWRFYVEAKDALRFKNQNASASLQVRHSVGSPVNFAINVYKPTVSDNFSSLTSISPGSAQSVVSDTNTAIYSRAVAMGDCSTGILLEVTAAIGAVTNKGMEITEVQLEVGSIETSYETTSAEATLASCQRYFFRWTPGQSGGVAGHGHSVSTTLAQFMLSFPVEMRSVGNILGAAAAGEFSIFETIGSPITASVKPAVFGASDSTRGSVFNVTVASGLTQWRPCWLSGTSNAYIDFDARL